jgi:hypothetical protein
MLQVAAALHDAVGYMKLGPAQYKHAVQLLIDFVLCCCICTLQCCALLCVRCAMHCRAKRSCTGEPAARNVTGKRTKVHY